MRGRVAKDPLAQLGPAAAARLASSAAAASASIADDEDNNMGLATSSFAFGPGPSKSAATDPKVRLVCMFYGLPISRCVHTRSLGKLCDVEMCLGPWLPRLEMLPEGRQTYAHGFS